MLKKCTQLLRAVHFQVKMNFFGSWDGEKAIEAPSTFPSQNLQKKTRPLFLRRNVETHIWENHNNRYSTQQYITLHHTTSLNLQACTQFCIAHNQEQSTTWFFSFILQFGCQIPCVAAPTLRAACVTWPRASTWWLPNHISVLYLFQLALGLGCCDSPRKT